jgi:hypothetical protein
LNPVLKGPKSKSLASLTHDVIVTDADMDAAIINVTLLNRSYRLMLKHANNPTKNVNTFHLRTNADMDNIVIVNDVYELMKSASCKPS